MTSSDTTENKNDSHKPHETPKRSGMGFGFLLGITFSLLLAAYPMYVAFDSKHTNLEVVGQRVLDDLQMQITLTHKELETVNRQLEIIADAEAKYSALVDQKFDLETSKTHLDERLAKLESGLADAEKELNMEANQFDRITTNMRLQ